MAKEKEKDEIKDEEEVAEPVEPSSKKSKPKKEGEIPIILIAGGALGGVVLIILSVVIGTIVANKLFPPYYEGIENAIQEVYADMKKKEETTEDAKEQRKLPAFPDEDTGFEGSHLFAADVEWFTFVSSDITTNTRGSTQMFAQVKVSIDYNIHYKEELVARGFAVEEPAAEKGASPTLKVIESSTLYKRFNLAVESKINDFIGLHSDAELQAMRQSFGEKLREELKPTFREFGLIIGKVNVTKFIVTRA